MKEKLKMALEILDEINEITNNLDNIDYKYLNKIKQLFKFYSIKAYFSKDHDALTYVHDLIHFYFETLNRLNAYHDEKKDNFVISFKGFQVFDISIDIDDVTNYNTLFEKKLRDTLNFNQYDELEDESDTDEIDDEEDDEHLETLNDAKSLEKSIAEVSSYIHNYKTEIEKLESEKLIILEAIEVIKSVRGIDEQINDLTNKITQMDKRVSDLKEYIFEEEKEIEKLKEKFRELIQSVMSH